MSFPTATQAHAVATAAASNFSTGVLAALVQDAINAAAAAGQFSCAINLSGYPHSGAYGWCHVSEWARVHGFPISGSGHNFLVSELSPFLTSQMGRVA